MLTFEEHGEERLLFKGACWKGSHVAESKAALHPELHLRLTVTVQERCGQRRKVKSPPQRQARLLLPRRWQDRRLVLTSSHSYECRAIFQKERRTATQISWSRSQYWVSWPVANPMAENRVQAC